LVKGDLGGFIISNWKEFMAKAIHRLESLCHQTLKGIEGGMLPAFIFIEMPRAGSPPPSFFP
jgi:hypothetical protein